MERPEFNVTITPKGNVKVEIKGVKGQRCVELADLLKEIVGKEEQRQLTTDYYSPDGKVRVDAKVRESTS